MYEVMINTMAENCTVKRKLFILDKTRLNNSACVKNMFWLFNLDFVIIGMLLRNKVCKINMCVQRNVLQTNTHE